MKHILILVLVLGSLFFNGRLSAQTGSPDSLKQQIEMMNRKLDQSMQQSNLSLENGDFEEAKTHTDALIKDLDVLIDALMPLDERISQLMEKEGSILDRTRQLLAEQNNRSTPSLKKNSDNLIQNQIVNREKTELTSKLLTHQLPSSGTNGQNSVNSQKEAADRSKILTDVKALLDEAASAQTAAIDKLEDQKLGSAEKKELQAMEALKKALERLHQNSKKPENKPSQSQSQQKKQQSSSSPQKQSGEQGNKGENKDMNPQQTGDEKKMTAEEALKELVRLRKQARDEKDRRRQQLGIQSSGEQVPVDKDW